MFSVKKIQCKLKQNKQKKSNQNTFMPRDITIIFYFANKIMLYKILFKGT